MKYLIMLFGDESTYAEMSEEDQAASMEQHGAFDNWCTEHNVSVLSGEALMDSPAAKTVSPNGTVTDGPYLEVKEQIGGYYLIETDSPELAVEAARICPNYGHNELRPVVDMQ